MERGIRQGCPISALLYLYIAEILSLKIKNNNMIEGFQAKNMNEEVKNIQHADDMTLALKNIKSLNQALNTINNFCIHAGSKINISKTECILLGPLKDMLAEIKGITVSKGAIRCLGIYIGHDKIECYNKNWMKVSHDIDTLFESWKKRKLTLFGKCTVTNSLAISKLVYLANILELPDENYIKKINRLIFNFIWNKTDRIKRNTMIGKIEDGGMGITDIESKFKALKASWVRKLENTDHCILSYLNSYVPKNIDFNYLAMTSEKRIENFEIIQAMPLFYKQVFTCFNACKNINDKLNIVHFIKQPIWSNEKFSYRGKSIYFPNWLKSNILYVKDLFTNNGVLKPPEDIMRILSNKNNWI